MALNDRIIGRSNDPSLTQRTTDSAAASDALRRGLAQLTSQGQNADRLAGIDNLASRDRTIIGQGFTGNDDPNFSKGTIDNRAIKQALDQSSTFGNNASAMGVLADSVGYTPKHRGTAGKTVSSLNDLMVSIPNKILAAQQTGAAAAKTQGTKNQEVVDKGIVLAGGVKPAGVVRTTTSGQQLSGEVKSKDPDQAQGIIDDIKKQFFMRKISGIPALSKLGIIDFRKDVDDNGKPVIVGIDAEGNEYDLNNLR